jgi:polyhydroxyalkanoate synthase subunit PhaC
MDNLETPLLPADMLTAAADLVDPAVIEREMPWLTAELTKISLGASDVWFDSRDKRFADPAWLENPHFHRLGQTYRLFELWMDRMCDTVEGPWQEQARARFLASIIKAGMAPSNYLLTNPAALRRAVETGGLSVFNGAMNMMRDLARGGMPSAVDRSEYPVGEKLACTPGAVVYREEMFELLQYAPSTPRVHDRPLLMVPPQVNRYYILDLAPGRSVAEYAVAQGIQTFMVVWRNPRGDLGHGAWGLDDYLRAAMRAAGVVKKITRSDALNWLGLCAGGMTVTYLLSYLAATGQSDSGAATFIVSMAAATHPNVVGMFDTGEGRTALEMQAAAGQVIPGTALRRLFALLRPNDLVFNYLVSGWLMGEPPTPFDVLAWNDDASCTTAKFALESTRIAIDEFGGQDPKAARPVILGTPIDLGLVTCDTFHVSGYTDHITPWRTCYGATQLLGGTKELTVVKSGHIQSFVNPADSSRYDNWYGAPTVAGPDEWLNTATVEHGSWWPRWATWLTARSGPKHPARKSLGSKDYRPITPAPGSYVHE